MNDPAPPTPPADPAPVPPAADPAPAPPADPNAAHYDGIGAAVAKHLAAILKPAEPAPAPPKDDPPKPGGLAGVWFKDWFGGGK